MPIQGLNIIGESLNDSVPSTHTLYEKNDWDKICELARFQEEKGAIAIDVNVGGRSVEMMKNVVRAVQESVAVPVSVDSPDYELAEAGLSVCDVSRGKPILNSISPLRMNMFDLLKICPFRPILLISELQDEQGVRKSAQTAEETFTAARILFDKAKKHGIENDDMIFDPGIAPIGSDLEGNLARLIKTLEMIQQTPDMKGVHVSVGLSNFTVMLPSKRKDGSPVKSPLESAFLTLTVPLGLDYVVGSVQRKYSILEEGHPALVCVKKCLESADGFTALSTVRNFYKK